MVIGAQTRCPYSAGANKLNNNQSNLQLQLNIQTSQMSPQTGTDLQP